MQFFFGDNRSKYDLLYTDAPKRSDAQSICNKISLPFSPEAGYDVFGYMPLGTNANSPMFFRCRHDTGITQRGAYYLHGVYLDAQPDFFFSNDYVKGIMIKYADQAAFDKLREDPNGFSYTLGVEEELMNAPLDENTLEKGKLIEILANVYQRNKFIIVVDDEAFEANYLRQLLRLVFSYLTPSLRKTCSYVTAMPTGGDFMIRIIKRSTYRKDRTPCVDLSAPPTDAGIPAQYYDLATSLIDATKAQRDRKFELFEDVYYGKLSSYQKQGFNDFLASDNGTVEGYEKPLTQYLEDRRFDESMGIPRILSEELSETYADEAYLDGVLNLAGFDVLKPLDYYPKNLTALRKYYFLASDSTFEYGRRRIAEKYAQNVGTIDDKNFPQIDRMIVSAAPNLTDDRMANLKSKIEESFTRALRNVLAVISSRRKAYLELTSESTIKEVLAPELRLYRDEPIPDEKIDPTVDELISRYMAAQAETLKEKNICITAAATAEAKKQIALHNKRANEKIAADKARREQEAFDAETKVFEDKFGEIAALMAQVEKQLKSQKAVKAQKGSTPISWKSFSYREKLLALREVPERFEEEMALCLLNHMLYSYQADEAFFTEEDEILRNHSDRRTVLTVIKVALQNAAGEPTAGWIWSPYAVAYAGSFKDLFDTVVEAATVYNEQLNALPQPAFKQSCDQFKRMMDTKPPMLTHEEHADCLADKPKLDQLLATSKLAQKLKPIIDGYLKKPVFVEDMKPAANETASENEDATSWDDAYVPTEKASARKPSGTGQKSGGWATIPFYASAALNLVLIAALVLVFMFGNSFFSSGDADTTEPSAVSDPVGSDDPTDPADDGGELEDPTDEGSGSGTSTPADDVTTAGDATTAGDVTSANDSSESSES